MNTYKTCTKCFTSYPRTPEFFYRNKSYEKYGERDSLQPYCKSCDDEKRSQRYLEHYAAEITRAANYRETNPEKVRESLYKWRKNSGSYNAYMRKYRAANK